MNVCSPTVYIDSAACIVTDPFAITYVSQFGFRSIIIYSEHVQSMCVDGILISSDLCMSLYSHM